MGDSHEKIMHLPSEVSGDASANNACQETPVPEVDALAIRPLDSVVPSLQPLPSSATLTISDLQLPEPRLRVSEQFSLLVSHVASPSCIYVHPVLQGAQVLLQLETSLKKHYIDPSHCVSLSSDSIQPGALCCIQSGDDHLWYRAVVCESIPNEPSSCEAEKQVEVMFVDYGLTKTVPATSLMLLDPSFTATAIQCVCCSLAGIRPTALAKSIEISYPPCVKDPSKQEQGKENNDHPDGLQPQSAVFAEGGDKVICPVEPSIVSPSDEPYPALHSSPTTPLSSPSSNTSSSPKSYSRKGLAQANLSLTGGWDEAAIQLLASLTAEKQLVGTVSQCFGKCVASNSGSRQK